MAGHPDDRQTLLVDAIVTTPANVAARLLAETALRPPPSFARSDIHTSARSRWSIATAISRRSTSAA